MVSIPEGPLGSLCLRFLAEENPPPPTVREIVKVVMRNRGRHPPYKRYLPDALDRICAAMGDSTDMAREEFFDALAGRLMHEERRYEKHAKAQRLAPPP